MKGDDTMEARTKLICNLSETDYFRLTDDENDRTLYLNRTQKKERKANQ